MFNMFVLFSHMRELQYLIFIFIFIIIQAFVENNCSTVYILCVSILLYLPDGRLAAQEQKYI